MSTFLRKAQLIEQLVKFDFQDFLLFHHISAVAILLPIMVSFFHYKHIVKELKTVSIFLCFVAVFEIICIILANYSINNLPFLHLYTIFEFSFLGLVFYQVFAHPSFKKAIIVTIIAFAAFAIINAFFIQTIYEFNTIAHAVESFLLILLALLFFFKVFHESAVMHLGKYPMFWINSGILIYFSGSFFLFIFSNYILMQSHDMLHAYRGIHSLLNILLNLFFAMGLWYSPQK